MSDDATGEAAFARAYRVARKAANDAAGTGRRLLVDDLARVTGLSPTPVREALSRLVGEGLVELQRGGGYFVPRLDQRDVEEHYVWLRMIARAAVAERALAATSYRTRHLVPIGPPDILVLHVAYCFERIAVASGNRLMALEMQRINQRMVAIRRAETEIFADLALQLERVAAVIDRGDETALNDWIDAYCRQGVALAGAIADWLSAPPHLRI